MSQTGVPYAIAAALRAGEVFVKAKTPWTAGSDEQRRFLERFYTADAQQEAANIPEIASIAARTADAINRFLRERGFTIALDPFIGEDPFGVASVLDVAVAWTKVGAVTEIQVGVSQYSAVRLTGAQLRFHRASGHQHPIAGILTQSGDRVFMTVAGLGYSDLERVIQARELSRMRDVVGDYDGLVFPMVNLSHQPDISWLKGMFAVGEDGRLAAITQAVQETRFRMNEHGARAESAVAYGATLGAAPPQRDLVINEPFLLWIERDGLSLPLFTAYVTPEDWKNPGSLG